jgi:hypothetical protein
MATYIVTLENGIAGYDRRVTQFRASELHNEDESTVFDYPNIPEVERVTVRDENVRSVALMEDIDDA